MLQREVRSSVANSFVQLQRQASNTAQKEYKIVNISRGGLRFESHDTFELNEIVQINIVIDQQTIHSASGRVCYRTEMANKNSSCYGLSFLDHFVDADLIRRGGEKKKGG